MKPGTDWFFRVRDYDLAATLTSGQTFRWVFRAGGWEGVIGDRWVRLTVKGEGIHAQAALPQSDWHWLENYLQTAVVLHDVLATFPVDEPMERSVEACRGLRLLRQLPWECLASFILSSSKQIVQIQQIVEELCERYGTPVAVPAGHDPVFAFPTAQALARCSEVDLRACKMGFRAPNLLRTAQMVARDEMDLEQVGRLSLHEARAALMSLPGVGEKVANCVLLFAYDFPGAFPVDVWVWKALKQLYFPKRQPTRDRLRRFAATHFGPQAGYAQQYLFHYMRVKVRPPATPKKSRPLRPIKARRRRKLS